MKELENLNDVQKIPELKDRPFYSATHDEIKSGATADIYFIKTREILNKLGRADTEVTAEIFPRRPGIVAGIDEVLNLLGDHDLRIWGLNEGEEFESREVILRIKGAYGEFGIFETAILGLLASSSTWATAARECCRAAEPKPVLCFGARHVHPSVAPVMERAALIGGAEGASCILGAKLGGCEPSGTVPHAIFLILGDSVRVSRAYHDLMPAEAPRIILIDTFKDEAEEALRVAEELKEDLMGVRLDTPDERGGVTPALVREVRARLDLAGYRHVKLFVSGGINPERIVELGEAGADAFGVGSYIAGADTINMTMDLKEVAGHPVAKRGRIPGETPTERLKRLR